MNGSDIRSRFGLGAALAALVWTGMAGAGAQAQTFDDRPSTFAPSLSISCRGKDDDEPNHERESDGNAWHERHPPHEDAPV